jgi:hypothetical protein
MKKAKLKTPRASSKASSSAKSWSAKSSSAKSLPAKLSPGMSIPGKTLDLVEIRRQITDLVGNGAVGMVETTMEEVGKGHYLGMKYLFEMIGLYPATSTDDAAVEDSMAATLLRWLGIPEGPTPDPGVTKDSGTTVSASEDVLE